MPNRTSPNQLHRADDLRSQDPCGAGNQLAVAWAPITYEPAAWVGDYFRASQASFPHAGSLVLASNYNSDEWQFRYRFARVWQFSDCVRAEKRWYDSDGELK